MNPPPSSSSSSHIPVASAGRRGFEILGQKSGGRITRGPVLPSGDLASPVRAVGTVLLLLDVSGSMSGEPLCEARQGAGDFARKAVASGFATGLATFGSHATLVTGPSTSLTALRASLELIDIEGSTNMADALLLAKRELAGLRPQRVACLVTDGCPDDRQATLAAAAECKRAGIDILTLGTQSADHAFLAQLATRADLAFRGETKTLAVDISRLAARLPGVTNALRIGPGA